MTLGKQRAHVTSAFLRPIALMLLAAGLLAQAACTGDESEGEGGRSGVGGSGGSGVSSGGSGVGGGSSSGAGGGGAGSPSGCVRSVEPNECRFAEKGDPLDINLQKDIINCPSERRRAPPGGIWWLVDVVEGDQVSAQSEQVGELALAVVRRNPFYTGQLGPIAGLRVPAELPPGTTVRVRGRTLEVIPPLPALDLDVLTLERVDRADLGGTALTVAIDGPDRERVLLTYGSMGLEYVSIRLGVQVIEDLLLSDATALCGPGNPAGAGEVLIPMWRGTTEAAINVTLADADDIENTRTTRLPAGDGG